MGRLSNEDSVAMSSNISGLRQAVAAILLLVAVGSVSACSDIHPDNTPHSPIFKG
jgi:hypothetical protein